MGHSLATPGLTFMQISSFWEAPDREFFSTAQHGLIIPDQKAQL